MKVQEYLEQKGVFYSEHEHRPAYTSQEVAAEEHVSGDMIAKPVVVRADGGYAMVVVPASYKLDMRKVAEALHTHQASLADEPELAKLFPDSEVGAEPPFGNLYNLPTLVDEHLTHDEEIVFQAGSHRSAIRMRYADYAELAHPQVADLAVHL
jgi:Ala-tRNA(Pro) deacylase